MPKKADVIGLDDLTKKFPHFVTILQDAARDAIKEAAENLETNAKRDAPKDTGRMARGIKTEYSKGGLIAEVAERDPERTHIARFIEEGTSSIPAQPFMGPNANRERRRLATRVEQQIKKRLSRL